jgi:hypothetical protein
MSEHFKKIWVMRRTRIAAGVVAAVVVALLVFHMGMVFEAKRLGFGHPPKDRNDWQFTTPFGMGFPMPHEFVERGHGVVGTVTAVGTSTISVTSRTGNTIIVRISSSTQLHGPTPTSTLSVGQNVVILGDPDQDNDVDGQFIRIIPPPPAQQ